MESFPAPASVSTALTFTWYLGAMMEVKPMHTPSPPVPSRYRSFNIPVHTYTMTDTLFYSVQRFLFSLQVSHRSQPPHALHYTSPVCQCAAERRRARQSLPFRCVSGWSSSYRLNGKQRVLLQSPLLHTAGECGLVGCRSCQCTTLKPGGLVFFSFLRPSPPLCDIPAACRHPVTMTTGIISGPCRAHAQPAQPVRT